ncbi:MAG: NAD(P)H-dependent oxidoreductase [Pseudomonadota bacterium]|nr:FMN-dependent NADH-azoreductase [Rhodovulum sp.]MCI5087372.1 NAD(P)H-dependent oxidoreductase [Rhodovulum sp.]MEE3316304.1 NAD(P)H-dependent oxidoreductase [Pseudomonadota bacterium]|tara:strand:- start:1027 stop:1644 length:618 start_codon:yes stop_codon:yes gene_type:complete
MTKLLHIIASPRGANSKSNALAATYVEAAKAKNPDLEVDVLDLFAEDLPAFDGDPAAAKMTFFGDGVMDESKQAAWDKVAEITNRFISADHYVMGVPMWNGGVPYRLKHYIDIITQPGMLFGFDPERGYFGLLENKKATVITSSGVWAPGADAKYGTDFHSNYLEWWLQTIGVSDIDLVRYQPSLLTADPAAGYAKAEAEAKELA